ncbi:Cytochrome c-type biogenesis protein (plasmid) [Cupriavidus necator H16]|uniref:Cytochrome c-type biogenesis protein n=1 Tax=Cupriavidus necator (strain ATCC 17699 / DSM 428 / KCTC 22496 / NCIMB 10442 / H16 / Stanier 337) TaxID=381666 RepID=Q7WXB5_CUPNH|nr:cytochrome c-type biogenesis protein [Cupriavidus necator]AAP85972.1 cytochrome C-type biogenesis protein [Cupriavidus necator H16]QCC05466.1 cytochrome c-type biogenesis protein CcmH [Cupriavidus necator H16]QQB81287.1 cytochrome c-type biogenesis protein CcmH [Cupriavidus necator]
MRRRFGSLLSAVICGLALHAGAATLSDTELDARVHALSGQLRCLVCQNQTLADSNADLAVDLRRQIRERLRGGASDEAVKDYLVQRYGDFVLYKPPLRPLTWLLWFGPLLLVAGVTIAIIRARSRSVAAGLPLDAEAQRQLAALLDETSGQPASPPAEARQP